MLLTLLRSSSGSASTVSGGVAGVTSVPVPSVTAIDGVQPVFAPAAIPTPAAFEAIEQTIPVTMAASTDDATWSSSTYADATNSWHWTGRVNGTLGAWSTYRFPTSAFVGLNNISSVKFRLTAVNTGDPAAIIRVNQTAAAAPTSVGSDRPDTRYASIGNSGEVTWSFSATAVGQQFTSPNLPAVLTALTNLTLGTDYLGISVGPVTGSGWAAAQTGNQNNGTASNRPALLVGVLAPINPTPSVVPVGAAASIPEPITSPPVNIAYTNGTALAFKDLPNSNFGSSGRNLSLWIPKGTAPAAGWPLYLWIHGGFFHQGDRAEIPPALVQGLLSRGVAVASVDYRLTEAIAGGAEAIANGNEASFPLGIHDVKVALRFFRKDKLESNIYNIDTDNTIIAGHSAGTSIAQFVAFTQGDTTTYSGAYPGSWPTSGAAFPFTVTRHQRPAHVGRSNSAPNTSYPFDFSQNGDTITASGNSLTLNNSYTIKGMFLFAPVVSLQNAVNPTLTPNVDGLYGPGTNRVNISLGRRYLISRSAHALNVGAVDTTVYGELDVDKYINPTTGTPTTGEPYRGKSAVVPDFPIGVAFGTADILTTKAAHYDQLVTALTNVGYVTSAPTTGVISTTKLTYFELAGVDHEGTKSNATGIASFFDWLDALLAVPITPESVAANATVPTPTWGQQIATVAVAASSTIPSPLVDVGQVPTQCAAQVTVPTPAWGSSTPTVAATATATIPTPQLVTGSTVAVTAPGILTTIPAPSLASGSVVSVGVSVGAQTTIQTPALVTGTTINVGSVGALSSIPGTTLITGSIVGVGAVSVATLIPGPQLASGVIVSPASTSAVVAIAAPSWGMSAGAGPVAVVCLISAPGFLSGSTVAADQVDAETLIPSPAWGQSVVVNEVAVSPGIGVPTLGSGVVIAVGAVQATTVVPALSWGSSTAATAVSVVVQLTLPTWGRSVLPAVVGATTTTPPLITVGNVRLAAALLASVAINAPVVSQINQVALFWFDGTSETPLSVTLSDNGVDRPFNLELVE